MSDSSVRASIVCLTLIGCSAGPTGHPDLSPAADLATPPDLSPGAGDLALTQTPLGALMPQVVQLDPSGSVLSTPNVVAVTWDNDPHRADIEAFFTDYAQSTAWATQTAEYGVGSLTAGTPHHLTGNAPAAPTDGEVQSLLKQNLGGAWGAPDPNGIYAFFFPSGSVVDDGTGAKCCTDFDGYHSDVVAGGVDVAYAIVCQCPGFDGPDITDLQQLTVAAAHETVEAATDPYYDNPGWAETDDAHAVWSYVTDGEVADLCDAVDTAYWTPSDMTHMIQRIWSNRAAAAGHDPCVGAPTEPYYQTVPDQNDAVTINIDGSGAWQTRGAKIAQSGTLMLHVYADAAAGPFTITVDDYSSVWLGGAKLLDVSVPSAPVNPGDSLAATVTVMGADASLGKAEAFVVNTTPVAGGPTTYYFGLVGQ